MIATPPDRAFHLERGLAMEANQAVPLESGPCAEERLESGAILFYPSAPFPLPQGDALAFLLRQELGRLAHKNISYNPATGKVTGFVRHSAEQEEQLRELFASFSRNVTEWLSRELPRYHQGLHPDRTSFRPLEEATRRLRPTARNDLLHIDAFPNRPSQGRRILRVYANVNPSEPRIWVTSEAFARLLARYGEEVGLPGRPGPGWFQKLSEGMRGIFRTGGALRSAYDSFMLRFHDYLKHNDQFQERATKRLWTFPPGSVWLAMTDGISHADLRGRFALEHSWFVATDQLVLPAQSPAALLATACSAPRSGRAA
jgi:hypothetical protein